MRLPLLGVCQRARGAHMALLTVVVWKHVFMT
jgi:hypothetical protein